MERQEDRKESGPERYGADRKGGILNCCRDIYNNSFLFQTATYCFVEFEDEEAARYAMLHINGRSIPNDPDRGRFNLSYANAPGQVYASTKKSIFKFKIQLKFDF